MRRASNRDGLLFYELRAIFCLDRSQVLCNGSSTNCYSGNYSKPIIAFTIGTFVDYKSILNQYCQKNKINPPKYKEAPGSFAGFASVVVVDGMEYRCNGVHTAKKLAAHDAAKWALMAMEVTEGNPNCLSL